MFAAMLVPNRLSDQPPATSRTAKRVPPDQYRVIMASSRSHWFQSSRSHALLMAAVARIPSVADNVTAIGFVKSCE